METKSHPDLNQTELTMIVEFMEEAAREFADHSANDFFLPATDDNKALLVAVLEHHYQNEPDDPMEPDEYAEEKVTAADIMADEGETSLYDFWVMAYFVDRCQALLDNPDDTEPLSPAELFALGFALDAAYEDHLASSDDVCYDLTYPATEDNKAIVTATVALFASEVDGYPDAYRREVAEKIQELSAALKNSDELDVPDFWLMYHLGHRCEELSGLSWPAE
jgi:hypothetical protein